MRNSIGVLFCLVCLAIGVPAEAQLPGRKPLEYKKGDKVQVEWAGKLHDAEVIGVNPAGLYQLSFLINGRPFKPTLPPRFVKPPKGSKPETGGAPARPSSSSPSGKPEQYKKGDKVQVEWAGKLHDAEVIGVNPAGFYQVSFLINGIPFKPTLPPQYVKPPKGGKPAAGGGNPTANAGPAKSSEGYTITAADWSYVRELTIGKTGGFSGTDEPTEWTADIEAGPPAPERLTSKPILLKRTGKDRNQLFLEQFEQVLFARDSAKAFAVVRNRQRGQPPGVDLYRCDLSTGKHDSAIRVNGSIAPVAFDGKGQLMLTTPDPFNPGMGGPGSKPQCRIDLWKVGAKSVERVVSWDPDRAEQVKFHSPMFAAFAGNNRVLTTVLSGEMTLWDAKTAQAVYVVNIGGGNMPGVSPGGRHLAVPANGSVYILDADSGDVVSKLPGTVSPRTVLSFRPDGSQLAAVSPQSVQVWDLKSGKLHRDIYLSTKLPPGKYSIDWVADGYVLISRQHLIDLERRIVLWKYDRAGGPHAQTTAGEVAGKLWHGLTSEDRTAMGIFQVALPHAAARTVAAGLKDSDLLAVQPGEKINIRVRVSGTAQEQEAVRRQLTEMARAAGLTVSPQARVSFEASTEPGESRQVTYRGFGINTTTVTATPQISRLKVTESGTTLWEASHVKDVPYSISLEEGQTVQQAVAENQKPDLTFFGKVKAPQYITRPNRNGVYGQSKLTHKGVE